MNTYGKRGVFFSVTEKPWSSLKTGQSAWGGVWGGEVPRPINFFKIYLKIVHSGGNFKKKINTKCLVYYLIIPLKNFFVMPKGGQAQGPPLLTPLLTTGYCRPIIAFGKDTFLLCFLGRLPKVDLII